MLPKDLTQDIRTRLATIRGQIEGIIKMLETEDPDKIVTQVKAVRGGIDTSLNILLDGVYRKALALKLTEANEKIILPIYDECYSFIKVAANRRANILKGYLTY